MYHSYFGIEEQAFSIAVNPRYLYMSAQHREALAHLLYGVNSGGFVMLTGEVGTGKTTIIRCLLEQLPKHADVAMIMNPAASARDLLCSICDELGIDYLPDETSLKILTDKLYEFLLTNHSKGRNTIVLIDEAQLLRVSTLEQIRLLTNLESNTQKLLQIILVGQPELNELLAKPALRQLSQRITARYHLRPLSQDETGAYIKHRLQIAGMPPGRQPFPEPIIKKVHAISGGIPRLINILCDRMLLGAYTQETTQIDHNIYKQATLEVMGERSRPTAPNYQTYFYLAAIALGLMVAALLIWLLLAPQHKTDAAPPAAASAPAQETTAPPTTAATSTPATTPPTATAPPTAFTSPPVAEGELFWQPTQNQALADLLGYIGVEKSNAMYPCWVVNKEGLHCETQKAATWDDFKRFNRPAVLSLTTKTRQAGYVALIGIDGLEGELLVNGQRKRISLETLGGLWTGEFVFIWRKPEGFEGPAGLGSKAPIVAWVAQRFASIDKQTAPLTTGVFNPPLQRRIKMFQQAHGITDDGLITLPTLLKLNDSLKIDKTLLTPAAAAAPN
ncbi:MAG TPA: AAA family ATPase [Cellvibrionaceae bacterium]|nr:AAA family ATPase [Cellvibrionaceae bacterium]